MTAATSSPGTVQPALAQREHEHVHVARRARQASDPGELGREALDGVIGKHVSDLPKKRPRAADRDPEVVQELGVERRTDAGLVPDDDLEQRLMHAASACLGRDRRLQVDGPRRIEALRRAHGAEHDAGASLGRALQAGPAFDHGHEPLVFVLVPAQGRERNGGRHRCPGRARERSRPASLDRHPGGCLALLVQDLEQRAVLLRFQVIEEPPDADDRRQPLLQWPIGKVPGKADRTVGPDLQALPAARLPLERRGCR